MAGYRILVCDPLAEEGLRILEEVGEADLCLQFTEAQLVEAISDADALIVRSGTQITAPIIEAAGQLKVIARAGVGVDNVDVAAATRRGILVVNCPTGNTIAAAEHTIALLLAAARNIPQAHSALKAGAWERKRFIGHQVSGKTLGVIGLGKIGSEVARGARGLGLQIMAYDPYIAPEHVASLGAQIGSLSEVLAAADFVTVHTALTEETRGLISTEQLELMKPEAILINCARGGIVDEPALLEALRMGTIAGAALDVFAGGSEPNPELIALDNVIVTPHLGASTAEAQVNVAVDAARQVVDVLSGQPPRWPVNMPSLPPEILAVVDQYVPLVATLAKLHSALGMGGVSRVELRGSGELSADHLVMLTRHFLVTLLAPVVDEPVNYVNAMAVAEDRGIQVAQSKTSTARGYANLIEAIIEADAGTCSVAGALLQPGEGRVVEIDGFEVELIPTGVALLIWNAQPGQPGFVGRLGTLLGDAGISIMGIQVARNEIEGQGMMVVRVAEALGSSLREQVVQLPGVTRTEIVNFD